MKLFRVLPILATVSFLAILGSTMPIASADSQVASIYTQLHNAEGRVVAAQHALAKAISDSQVATEELQQATATEGVDLAKLGDSYRTIGIAGRDMYINGNIEQTTLILDVVKNGPQALLDNAKYTNVLARISDENVSNALQANTMATTSTMSTEQALENYAKANQALVDAQRENYDARTAFLALAGANNVNYHGLLATSYTDSPGVLPGAQVAIARSLSYVGQPELACSDGLCFHLCDHLAGEAWGYSNSGYETAREHWTVMVATGHAHIGDTHPPVGALLFWDTGLYGHVAVYVGNGMIVTNMIGPQGIGVYRIRASDISVYWGAKYWGWSDPVFVGRLESGGQ